VEPEEGQLASGMIGKGRLAGLDCIVEAVIAALSGAAGGAQVASPVAAQNVAAASVMPEQTPLPAAAIPARTDLAGLHIVVTAGGTSEPIDPVRFVGNRSTGKMGIAVAEDALDRGAAVTLILGSATVEPPAQAHIARAETAAEMQVALQALTPPEGPLFDVLVMAAAVADFRPRSPAEKKLARSGGMTIEMDPTPDLLAETAERAAAGTRASGKRPPVLVGFAAETGSFERVTEKLRNKGVDLLVANDVVAPGSGFGVDTNKVTIYSIDLAPEELPLMSKREVAELLLDRVVIRLQARTAGQATVNAQAPTPAVTDAAGPAS